MADWFISSAAWAAIAVFATGTFTVGQIVRPLTAPAFNAQYAFRCTTAGTASAEPTWPAGNNATVTATGGAVFTNVSGQGAYGWSAAAGNLYAITSNGAGGARPVAADRVFLSSDHAETNSAGSPFYILTSAQGYGIVEVVSVNRAGSVPPQAADQLSGANITLTSGTPIFEPYTNVYWQGVTFTIGGAAGGLSLASSGAKGHYFRNCAFVFTTSNTSAAISSNNPMKATLDNTTVTFNGAGQRFSISYPIDLAWINTPSAVAATVPTYLFENTGGNAPQTVTCRGVDLTALTTTLYYGAGSASYGKILLDSCKIASGLVRLGTGSYLTAADEVELVSCFDGTNILSERHTPAGDLTTDRSTTMVSGAQDDTSLFAHKLVSSVRADGWAMTLDSFWLDVENTLVGSSHTATVEIISSATLNNTDISLVLEYLGTSGSSLASFTSTLPNALTASAALPTSSATWNSPPATPVAQHLQATFTPQKAGRLRGLVRLGKPSTTVWLNPQIAVT